MQNHFFEIPVTGIDRCRECNDAQIKKHMDSCHSVKLPMCHPSRSSVVNISSTLWYHFTSDINKKTWFVANFRTKMVFIKQNVLKIFQNISFYFLKETNSTYFLKETNSTFKRNIVNW